MHVQIAQTSIMGNSFHFFLKRTLFSALMGCCLLNSSGVFSQSNKLGSWETINITYKSSKHFTAFLELQARSQSINKDFFYHEVKGGVGYQIPKKFSAILAMGDYRTYEFEGNFKNQQMREFRLWQQLTFTSMLGSLRMEHRYRAEQRWQNGNYKNRFRYRVSPVLPLNNKTIEPGTLYLSAFNELFFTNRAPYFERNRFFAGLGYQIAKSFAIQTGYLNQYDYRKIDDGRGKTFLQTTLLFFLDDANFAHRHPGSD